MTITTEEADSIAVRLEDVAGCVLDDDAFAFFDQAAGVLRALAAERDKLSRALSDAHRARGEAEGKLAASEMAGVVEGWKARAERAEAEAERLRAQLKGRQWVAKWQESQVAARIRAEAEAERLREATHRIKQWSEAYPLDVFPELDFARARELLEAGGMTLDAVAASCMRRVVKDVGEIARAALEGGKDADQQTG